MNGNVIKLPVPSRKKRRAPRPHPSDWLILVALNNLDFAVERTQRRRITELVTEARSCLDRWLAETRGDL